jgi:hypothetical protein
MYYWMKTRKMWSLVWYSFLFFCFCLFPSGDFGCIKVLPEGKSRAETCKGTMFVLFCFVFISVLFCLIVFTVLTCHLSCVKICRLLLFSFWFCTSVCSYRLWQQTQLQNRRVVVGCVDVRDVCPRSTLQHAWGF